MPTFESRAAFQRQHNKLTAAQRYGKEISPGEPHIVWEVIGAHAEVYNFKS